jgi:hypothetical protein
MVAIRIKQIVNAFALLYAAIHDRHFRKTLKFNTYNERALAPLVRTFLLGWFGHVSAEVQSVLPGSLTGYGSIDFLIGNVAVEFAVRRRQEGKSPLSDVTNSNEIKKLIKHPGPAVLVLYDFSARPFDKDDLNRYRDWRSLGQGHHKISSFNVAYFYRSPGKPITNQRITLNVRPRRR